MRAYRAALSPASDTVGQLLDVYLKGLRNRCKPNTVQNAEAAIRVHLRPTFGHIPLSALSPLHVQAWIERLESEGLKPTTIRNRLTYLKGALSWALKSNLVKMNAAALADAPQAEPRGQALSPAEAMRVLELVPSSHLGIVWALCLGAGLRHSEALGLQWADVDIDGASILVHQQLQREDGTWVFTELKTKGKKGKKRSFRLPIPAFLVTELRRHRAWQSERRLLLGKTWPQTDLVCTGRFGRPVSRSTSHTAWKTAAQKLGIPASFRVHDLRHSCASLLIESGESMKTVQAVLRHASISITMDLYTHVREEVQKKAASALDNIVTGQSAKADLGS